MSPRALVLSLAFVLVAPFVTDARAQFGPGPGMGGPYLPSLAGAPPEGVAPPTPVIDAATLMRSTRVRCGDLVVLGTAGGTLRATRNPDDKSRFDLTVTATPADPNDPANQWLVRAGMNAQATAATHLGCAPGAPMSLADTFVLEHVDTGLRLGHDPGTGLAYDLVTGLSGALEVGASFPLRLARAPTYALSRAGTFAPLAPGALPDRFTVTDRRASILRESPLAVRCGAAIRMRNLATSFRLHSHALTYFHRGTSGQQQVTGFALSDDNDLFTVKLAHGQSCTPGTTFRHGDIIRLTHRNTGRNLHSHAAFFAPAAGVPQEVTAFGQAGEGDANDDWRLVLYEQRDGAPIRWLSDHAFALVHVRTGLTLSATGARFPIFRPPTRWSTNGWTGIYDIDWQGEIMANAPGPNSAWVVETQIPAGDPAGPRRALTLVHSDATTLGAPSLSGDLHALTERGYITEIAASRASAIGGLARWTRDARAGQTRLVHFAGHGTAGTTLASVLDGHRVDLEAHGIDMTESKVGLAMLSPYLRTIGGAGAKLAVLDASCEGGNTVLASESAPYCALSTTSFEGPGLFDRPALRTFVAGFDALGSSEGAFTDRGAGALQGELIASIGPRIQQRIFRNGCADTGTQMAIRSALMRHNHLGGWVLLPESRALYGADTAPQPYAGDVNVLAFELSVTRGNASQNDSLITRATTLLDGRLAQTTSLERWTYAARSGRLWDELLGEEGDMMALRSLPPSEWPDTYTVAVDPLRYHSDLATLRADLRADLARLMRLDAERKASFDGLIAALHDSRDTRDALPAAVRDLALSWTSEYRAIVASSRVAVDAPPDLDRLWVGLGQRRSVSVFLQVARLRWNELAQNVVLTRMQPLLTLDEDIRCAVSASPRPCDGFRL
jgi:hypothetical protein